MRKIAYGLLLLLIFMLPWEGVARFPGIGNGAKILGTGLALFWLVTVVQTNRLRKPDPFIVLLCLFVCWNAATVFWSADPQRTLAHVMTWFQLLGLALVLWDLLTTRTRLLVGLQAYVLGAFVAIGSAASNFLSGNVYYTHYQRFSPGDTNPDGFGFLLALGIPVAWHLAGSRSVFGSSCLFRLVNYVYIPAAFFGLALSGTRTALIASIVGMAFGLATLTRLKLWVRVAILVLLATFVFTILPYVQTLRSFERLGTTAVELTEGDLNNRTNNWREGLEAFQEHPLVGVGSNMYRSINSLGKVAHNSFLSVLVELGLIGFLLFSALLATAVLRALIQPKWEAAFWLTILLVWAIGASTLTWEHRKTTWLFLSMVVAAAAVVRQRQALRDPPATAVEGRPYAATEEQSAVRV